MSTGSEAAEETAALIAAIRAIMAETGDIPAERVLAERLQVKRHRLRLALRAMREAHELPPTQTGRRRAERGASHAEQHPLAQVTNPIEVIEMRRIIEPKLARLAALRASPSEIAMIVKAATTGPGEAYGAADVAFHRAIASASRNRLALELYTVLRTVGADARVRVDFVSRSCPKRLRERDEEHRAIATAIAERDPAGAEKAMSAHLAVVQERVAQAGMPAPALNGVFAA